MGSDSNMTNTMAVEHKEKDEGSDRTEVGYTPEANWKALPGPLTTSGGAPEGSRHNRTRITTDHQQFKGSPFHHAALVAEHTVGANKSIGSDGLQTPTNASISPDRHT